MPKKAGGSHFPFRQPRVRLQPAQMRLSNRDACGVLALIVVVLFPALALAQANDKDQDKVSNDQPDRPLADAAGHHRGEGGAR